MTDAAMLGRRFRILRRSAGISQDTMASYLGVCRKTMYQYEHGSTPFPADAYIKGLSLIGYDTIFRRVEMDEMERGQDPQPIITAHWRKLGDDAILCSNCRCIISWQHSRMPTCPVCNAIMTGAKGGAKNGTR